MKLLIILFLFTCACSSANKRDEPKDTLLGAPPTAKDDPFFFATMPAEATQAESSGTIGSTQAENNPPNTVPSGDGVQCFSCVRVCAKESQCGDKSDLICGWGVHPVREIAMTRATAECDGALNLARYAPTWSAIEGDCPIAKCQ